MTEARAPRQFGSTEHLASEAIAAYVDGELRMQAYLRASHHISLCAECTAAVDAQQQARGALRRSGEMTMPLSLVGLLSAIPTCTTNTADNTPGSDAGFGAIGKRLSRRWRK
ncbi:RNA polymerase subunit sigma-70 [Rhodococcus sp. KBS0724]|uniref:RNA polymerase subunit sigma-70 n=1 Tax=Rhodococcus sp. KBS0724 TaxID=1179674 RepID=UPI00110E3201|nr:RNA polymerase subunit sigma-70 [Rhodococcus sp. KBS0724]TSD46181.1 RNA polymerase subunit sigma-70 [Rhodococcus sp. KBS0724]